MASVDRRLRVFAWMVRRQGSIAGKSEAEVIALMRRGKGATLAEIISATGWQKHTVRGFMAGAMKKAGYTVESFKSDKVERSYRMTAPKTVLKRFALMPRLMR